MTAITAAEVKERLTNGEQLHLLDVREPHEHAEFNIGGILLPLGKVQTMQVDEIEDWKNEEVICYCKSGNRSGQAAMFLEMQGFTNVKNLTGGMMNWQAVFGG